MKHSEITHRKDFLAFPRWFWFNVKSTAGYNARFHTENIVLKIHRPCALLLHFQVHFLVISNEVFVFDISNMFFGFRISTVGK